MKNIVSKTWIILAIISLLVVSNSCRTNGDKEIGKVNPKSIYDKVMEKGVIRVGYIPYEPALIKDPNTKELSGIFYDVLMEVGKNLDMKVEFAEEVGWGNMVEAVKSNKDDIICTAVYAKSERGKFVDFTLPLYYSPMKAYVSIDNKMFDNNLARINSGDVKISAIDGEAVSTIAKTDFPKAKIVSLTQSSDVSQMLQEVAAKKADITFVEPVFANIFIKNNPNKIREVPLKDPIRIYPVVMMVAKDDGKFLSIINIAIQELQNNGFIEKAIAKYEPLPNSFFRVQKPYIIK